MTTFISDFVVGVKAIKAARGMRKRGATGIEIVPIKAIPVVNIGRGRRRLVLRSPKCRRGPAKQ